MDRALAIEDAFDRERSDIRNAPRTLDVDLIVVGDRRSETDDLRLPHPRADERAFVLQPWYDVEPDAVLPGGDAVADLLEKTDRSIVTRRDDLEPSSSDLATRRSGRSARRTGRTPTASHPSRRARCASSGPGVVVALCVGLVAGWLVRRVASYAGSSAPLVTWTQAGVLFMAAAILGLLAWHTRRALDSGHDRPEPHRLVNRLVLARASALGGVRGRWLPRLRALLAGRGAEMADDRALRAMLAGLGGCWCW